MNILNMDYPDIVSYAFSDFDSAEKWMNRNYGWGQYTFLENFNHPVSGQLMYRFTLVKREKNAAMQYARGLMNKYNHWLKSQDDFYFNKPDHPDRNLILGVLAEQIEYMKEGIISIAGLAWFEDNVVVP